MAVFIMLPMKVQAATHDVSTLEELKTVVASVYSGDTINITGDITLDSDLTITNPNALPSHLRAAQLRAAATK